MQRVKTKSSFFLVVISLFLFANKIEAQLGEAKTPLTQSSYFFASEHFSQAGHYYSLVDFYPILKDFRTPAEFYKITADLRLNRQGSEKKLSRFIVNNPTSYLTGTVYYDLATFHFLNGKYSYALKWYNSIKASNVEKGKRNEYYFNKGYTLFATKRYKQAGELFKKIKDVPKYQYDANYYLGYIAYQQEDYNQAIESFNSLAVNKDDTTIAYFQADMNFKLGQFKQAISLAEKGLDNANENETSELSKIIGESYFNLEDYKSALPYLEAYKGKKGKWSNTDFYQLGYTFYRMEQYDKAIKQFNKIISGNNSIAQNAYYHLADCYLKKNKKTSALNAFKSASNLKFDKVITEDAFLNYARLSYEIGNAYENTLTLLTTFLDRYPNNEAKPEVEQLLIDSYVNSRNFDAALLVLKKKSGSKFNGPLQKVYYMKAVSLYQNGIFAESVSFFEKALKIDKDRTIEANCLYWMSLAQYELNNFDAAIDNLKRFENHSFADKVVNYEQLSYHLGYAYFKQKLYEEAIVSFQSFLNQSNIEDAYRRDAMLRVADSHFVLGKYWPAIEMYDNAIRIGVKEGAYAHYQKALGYGFVDRNLKKIETLETLISGYSETLLLDDAYFELALAYTKNNNTSKAIAAYNQLISDYTKSPYRSKALLNKGLVLYNDESLEKAMKVLRQVVQEYPNDEVTRQALRTAKEISIDLATVDEFAAWTKQLKGITLEDNELEQAAFMSANRLYNNNKKKDAQKALESYLIEYPLGPNQLQAKFLLAELYFQESEWAKAIELYIDVLDQSTHEFTEQALVRVTQSMVNNNQKLDAQPYWERLEEIAQFKENQRYSLFNLMQLHYEQERFSQAISYTEKVLALEIIEQKIKWDAYIILARSAVALNDLERATAAYSELEKSPDTSLAVEALYFDAEQKHKKHQYEDSNKVIEKIAQYFSGYPEWGAKSLLLMSQNFYQLDDAFQATFILESILTNFTQFPDIIEQAKSNLENIEAIEAKSNSSINIKNEDEEN